MNRQTFLSYKADLHRKALQSKDDALDCALNDSLTFIKVDRAFPKSLPKKRVGLVLKDTTVWLLTADPYKSFTRTFDCRYAALEFVFQLPHLLTLDIVLQLQFKTQKYDGLPF